MATILSCHFNFNEILNYKAFSVEVELKLIVCVSNQILIFAVYYKTVSQSKFNFLLK